jgi:hypothetical protein
LAGRARFLTFGEQLPFFIVLKVLFENIDL